MSEKAQKYTTRFVMTFGCLIGLASLIQFSIGIPSTTLTRAAIISVPFATLIALTLQFWNKPRARLFMLSITVICTLIICVLALRSSPVGVSAELWYNQRRWQAQQISGYRYTLQISCFCPREQDKPVRIEVRNGLPVSITYLDSGVAAVPYYFDRYSTIQKLFDRIGDINAESADYFSVAYDRSFGYPTVIDVDSVYGVLAHCMTSRTRISSRRI